MLIKSKKLMDIKSVIFACLFILIIGIVSGYSFHSTFICPDTNKAVVKQIKSDGKKLIQVKKEVQIKYVYRDKIKTVIKTVASDECFDSVVPDSVASGLLDAFNATRP